MSRAEMAHYLQHSRRRRRDHRQSRSDAGQAPSRALTRLLLSSGTLNFSVPACPNRTSTRLPASATSQRRGIAGSSSTLNVRLETTLVAPRGAPGSRRQLPRALVPQRFASSCLFPCRYSWLMPSSSYNVYVTIGAAKHLERGRVFDCSLHCFSNISDAIPQASAGSIRLLAVSSEKRAPQLPDVPTIAEAGFRASTC